MMVDRFHASLLPNGLVRLFDQQTQSASLFETRGYRVNGGRRVIALHSGPEILDCEGWDTAYKAFPPTVHVGSLEEMQRRVERLARAFSGRRHDRAVLITVLRRLTAAASRHGM